mmetsp:Transcript_10431/g.29752  ORF Transcript_10431/g.29752 Transcript_10431/m.29752 type:complete len:228 (+) Transcript_10431:478-1161(+)
MMMMIASMSLVWGCPALATVARTMPTRTRTPTPTTTRTPGKLLPLHKQNETERDSPGRIPATSFDTEVGVAPWSSPSPTRTWEPLPIAPAAAAVATTDDRLAGNGPAALSPPSRWEAAPQVLAVTGPAGEESRDRNHCRRQHNHNHNQNRHHLLAPDHDRSRAPSNAVAAVRSHVLIFASTEKNDGSEAAAAMMTITVAIANGIQQTDQAINNFPSPIRLRQIRPSE